MEPAALAHAQMGFSLAFHIVFAAFVVGLPLLLVVAEALADRTGTSATARPAHGEGQGHSRRGGRRALSLELGLLWPGFMRRFGEVVGPLFALEGIVFLLEATFLGVVLYGRGLVCRRAIALPDRNLSRS